MGEALRDYYGSFAELERAIGTTIPASGFAPAQVSVLPDLNRIAPNTDAESTTTSERAAQLRCSLESVIAPVKSSLGEASSEPQMNIPIQFIEKGKP
ncbi:MAG: hypothetical protein MSG64_18385 [Pyrinomonadaceae bacterium MAG19_C2-C3]|nr:hypothetical protein [Pyrinomonadaceae bacterium MAG19_C2-C3]